MSKIISTAAIDGATHWVARAEQAVAEAISVKGADCAVAFPGTAYYLPIIYSFTGEKIERLQDLKKALDRAKALLPERPSEKVWLPYLGAALDAGVAALFACEAIEACRYLVGTNPINGIWLGAASDVIMRERGIEFVDGTAPGFAAITGAAPTNAIAVQIARELQQKNLYVFMAGSTNGKQFAEQLAEAGVQLGWKTRLVPFGADVSALIYALGFANRVALSFGGVAPGDYRANLAYNKSRIFAFVLALGEVDAEKYALAAGAINYGFPVIADTDIPQILPTGVCTYEHVVASVPYETLVERALEVRGCKIKTSVVPIPVPYGVAFAGERIRKQDIQVEFGGNITPAFEFVTMTELDEIEDGEITIIGKDIDEVAPGSALPLAIWVEVAGRKMQSDFESILERQIHHLVNGAEGIWHMGQRDIVWSRVSQSGYERGLRLRHYGEIIHSQFLAHYPAIVDKVKVTLITELAEVERRLVVARQVYQERNRRLEAMTDESVDTFYSCLLCQSFAPDHVCIITPQRLGLCGAYNWLDGRAAYEIDQTGPNQPVKKGDSSDPTRGIFQGVDEYVYANSHRKIASFSIYSIMHKPMTSCGCFEVIVAYVPECNGVMAVNREYTGDTPVGMTFSALAGSVGGGKQTPGFMGCGKVFLYSPKFLFAEGGQRRYVWMPKELKDLLRAELNALFEREGNPGMLDMIADETISVNPTEIRAFMEKQGHPALTMADMLLYAEDITVTERTDKAPPAVPEAAAPGETLVTQEQLALIKKEITTSIKEEIRANMAQEIVGEIIEVLEQKFLGKTPEKSSPAVAAPPQRPTASERIATIKSFALPKTESAERVHRVILGADKSKGGTRGVVWEIGGAAAMPFHHWEGAMPNRPLVAMEVFDRLSEKYPAVLHKQWGELLKDPPAMARACVEDYGADLISVRLDGTHPERGNISAGAALDLVKSILAAVATPLIITGHIHFEKNNEVMKEIARGCAGENLLLHWVEQDNYRTIAGAALAYGHSVVAHSPIDVNIAKQLNILLSRMDVPIERIVLDPMTGAMGYGIEYTYSVMERIRATGLGGDKMLLSPLLVSPGQECVRIKEFRALESDFPAWGELAKRAALWELATASALMYAGADILIMYHPQAAMALKRRVLSLME